MPANKLRCRDRSPGDILLKVSDGSILSRAIQTGQSLVGGKNPGVVHAGVMFDSTFIVEAQGAGVSANDLRVQNKSYGYYVYQFVAEQCGVPATRCSKRPAGCSPASAERAPAGERGRNSGGMRVYRR